MALRGILDPGDWLGMKPRLDPAATPIRLQFEPDPAEIRLRFWVGGVILGVAALAVVYGSGIVVFVASGFAFFALLNLLYALLQIRFRFEMTITGLEVSVARRSILGRKNWREPLRNYRGVVLRDAEVEQHSGSSKTRSWKRYFIVELQHADPARTVPLFVSESGLPPRDEHVAFASRFRLPALEEDLGTQIEAAGPRALTSPGPPPPRVRMQEVDGVVCLGLAPRRLWRVAAVLFWLLLPAVIGGFLYQIDPHFGLMAGVMTAIFALVMLGMSWIAERGASGKPQGLCLSREAIWIGAAGPPPRIFVPIELVREVRLARRNGRLSLNVTGGTSWLSFGGTREDREALEWMRAWLVYQLAGRRVQ